MLKDICWNQWGPWPINDVRIHCFFCLSHCLFRQLWPTTIMIWPSHIFYCYFWQVFRLWRKFLKPTSADPPPRWCLFNYSWHPLACTYNDRDNCYSQPKAELFGVFWAFKHLCHQIWGIHFCLEHDTKFPKEMITSPDLPNSPMTRWIVYLLLFNFNLKHIKAKNHKAPNGLSQWPQSTKDSNEDDAEEFLNHFIGNSKWIVDVASAQDVPSSEDLDTNQVKCLLSTLYFQSHALNQMHSTTGVSCAPIKESDSSEKRRFHTFVSLVEESKPHFNTYICPMRTTYLHLVDFHAIARMIYVLLNQTGSLWGVWKQATRRRLLHGAKADGEGGWTPFTNPPLPGWVWA